MSDEPRTKCEICGKNDSMIHVQQIMGSEIIELHLCEECAEKKGISGSGSKIELSISELLNGLLDFSASGEKGVQDAVCPVCGLEYADFQKSGRLGCTECAHTFRKEIRRILQGISGTTIHKGKYPKKLKTYKTILIDREHMKQKLKEAVINEDYETAAVLRDKIYDLESLDMPAEEG
jgi:protein arginine kinase activator